jgi:hypothetical protein
MPACDRKFTHACLPNGPDRGEGGSNVCSILAEKSTTLKARTEHRYGSMMLSYSAAHLSAFSSLGRVHLVSPCVVSHL